MRTHYCGLVDEALIGQTITLCGWADTRRDHGGVIFIDLRDHEGIVQAVIEPDNATAFKVAEGVRYEFCLRLTGTVRARPASQINDRLRTGKIEVIVDSIEVLNAAAPLPFMLTDTAGEDARLRYRYLDIRRPDMARHIDHGIASKFVGERILQHQTEQPMSPQYAPSLLRGVSTLPLKTSSERRSNFVECLFVRVKRHVPAAAVVAAPAGRRRLT